MKVSICNILSIAAYYPVICRIIFNLLIMRQLKYFFRVDLISHHLQEISHDKQKWLAAPAIASLLVVSIPTNLFVLMPNICSHISDPKLWLQNKQLYEGGLCLWPFSLIFIIECAHSQGRRCKRETTKAMPFPKLNSKSSWMLKDKIFTNSCSLNYLYRILSLYVLLYISQIEFEEQ